MLERVAALLGARRVRRLEHVQRLWRGYGEIVRVAIDGGPAATAIVKHVRPPPAARESVSDRRKRGSYDVEQHFYRGFAPRCDEACRVARMYASHVEDGEWLLVLEDLDAAGYDGRHDEVAGPALDACLAWLAAFHARFLGDRGEGLWPQGSYWHLGTRRDELAAIAERTLRDRADELDGLLAGARFQTIVHGDPKEANFCFARSPVRVAAVDFQYAGRGCGMRDVAYLLHGRTDGRRAAQLDTYFAHLRAHATGVELDALEREWRALDDIARLDFERFLAGWRPRGSAS